MGGAGHDVMMGAGHDVMMGAGHDVGVVREWRQVREESSTTLVPAR